MQIRSVHQIFALVVLLLSSGLAACSSDPACTTSTDCDRGKVCDKGNCAVFACTGDDGCANEDAAGFQESCAFLGSDGSFDPAAGGVCTSEECQGIRDCEAGTSCIEGVCYAGADLCASVTCSSEQTCNPANGQCETVVSDRCPDVPCPTGQSCNSDTGLCSGATDCRTGISCPTGQNCNPDTGLCSGATDLCAGISCPTGQTCSGATGLCQDNVTAGSLCAACTSDAACTNGKCVTLAAGSFCGQSCTATTDCGTGFTCFDFSGTIGKQCIPLSGRCDDCNAQGCSDGSYCEVNTGNCRPATPSCGSCLNDLQCGAGAVCAQLGTGRVCLDSCTGGGCESNYTCSTTAVPGSQLCAPSTGSCTTCNLTAGSCTGGTPVLDAIACRCVGCVSATDCDAGETCTASGQCLAQSGTCTTSTDCGATGYCVEGFCVDCLTASDCAGSDLCVRGVCAPCTCPTGQICDRTGACVDQPTGGCVDDVDCIQQAQTLGDSGTGATCDTDTGACFILSVCNPTGGLGTPSRIDPFNAACPGSTTCTFDLLSSTGRCNGCSSAADCRTGESCYDCTGTTVCVDAATLGIFGAFLCTLL